MRTLSITPHTTYTKPTAPTPGAWGRIRRAAAEIGPDAVERIAQRVAQLLRGEHDDTREQPATPGLIDAFSLAKHLGLTRAWVYEHAHELGAIRVGNGPRARLRFDLATARAALAGTSEPQPSGGPATRTGPQPRRRRRPTQPSVPLLPVHESGVRRLFTRSIDAVNCLSYRPWTASSRQRQDGR